MRKVILVLTMVSVLVFQTGCSGTSAMEEYYYNEIEGSGIENAFVEIEPILTSAMTQYEKDGDYEQLEITINEAIEIMTTAKETAKAIKPEEETVATAHNKLVNSLENLEKGYQTLLIGYKEMDAEILKESQEYLQTSQQEVMEWQNDINE